MQRLFESQLFRDASRNSTAISLIRFKLFAEYTCLQDLETSEHSKAIQIGLNSFIDSENLLIKEEF